MDAKQLDINSNTLSSSQKINILLVDDQAMVAEGIKRMLESEQDMVLHYCDDPKQAMAMANELNPTIILQDLVMPDIDGMTLVRFYRSSDVTKDTPVIVLSSKEDPAVKRDAFQNGANDYLVKLPDQIELIARIRLHSKHYLLQLERNAAFFALREMQLQLQKTNQELERLSSLDGLTGIANRRVFDSSLNTEWDNAKNNQRHLALILIDIDYFKLYNDSYGHQQGDDCLCMVAKTLKNVATRPKDLVARYGGEEFVIIAPSTDTQGALKVAENIHQAIHELKLEHTSSKSENIVTISQGICSLIPDDSLEISEIIKRADQALYKAKEQGRNRFVAFEE